MQGGGGRLDDAPGGEAPMPTAASAEAGTTEAGPGHSPHCPTPAASSCCAVSNMEVQYTASCVVIPDNQHDAVLSTDSALATSIP